MFCRAVVVVHLEEWGYSTDLEKHYAGLFDRLRTPEIATSVYLAANRALSVRVDELTDEMEQLQEMMESAAYVAGV
eukprot:COSAG01_NODE_55452_length_325_cov_0.548673_1_plen_75_part_01